VGSFFGTAANILAFGRGALGTQVRFVALVAMVRNFKFHAQKLHTSMLVKQDQYVEKSDIYVEFPYLCPNYNIYVQTAIYIFKL